LFAAAELISRQDLKTREIPEKWQKARRPQVFLEGTRNCHAYLTNHHRKELNLAVSSFSVAMNPEQEDVNCEDGAQPSPDELSSSPSSPFGSFVSLSVPKEVDLTDNGTRLKLLGKVEEGMNSVSGTSRYLHFF